MILTSSTLSAALCASMATVPPGYQTTVLPQLDPNAGGGGWVETSGSSINNFGMVTGAAGINHGFTWSPGSGGSIWLPSFAGSIVGSAINNSGELVGSYWPSDLFVEMPFHRAADGTFTQLQTLGTNFAAYAADINDHGLIVGGAALSIGGPGGADTTAVYWQNGQIHQIGSLGGVVSAATAVNNNNVVVGYSNTPFNDAVTGFVWTESSGMVELERLAATGASTPAAINDAGIIVGQAGHGLFDSEAVYWDADGNIHVLDRFHAGETFTAGVMDINNSGFMVGFEESAPFELQARLWHDGDVYNLQELALDLPDNITLTRATGINDLGQIIADGTMLIDGNIEFVTVMLTPIPAPGALAALLPALLGGIGRTRRRG